MLPPVAISRDQANGGRSNGIMEGPVEKIRIFRRYSTSKNKTFILKEDHSSFLKYVATDCMFIENSYRKVTLQPRVPHIIDLENSVVSLYLCSHK